MTDRRHDLTWRTLVALFLPGIGKQTLWQVVSRPEFAQLNDNTDLANVFPELDLFRTRTSRFTSAVVKAEHQLEQAEREGVRIINYWDPEYPKPFRAASLAPAVFWFKGDLEALRTPSVTVIGTRYPTAAGSEAARRIATALSQRSLCITSGLALGIDSIAHRAATSADGRTIAILPAGLDKIAPKKNADLAQEIMTRGGLLSEFPIGHPPFSGNFVIRDATQAAMSAAVILIQSDLKGGSLHASRAAVRLGRPLIVAAPAAIDVANGEPKVEANQIFFRREFNLAASTMRFPDDVEKHTYLLSSRNQYDEVEKMVLDEWERIEAQSKRRR